MNKTVLITGGGRGIGAATARLAVQAGYRVAFSFLRNETAATALVAEITAAGGVVLAIRADVGVEADVIRMYGEVDTRLGYIDALVNNAGIVAQQSRLEDMSAERLNQVFATNITGSFLCAREAVKRMSLRHGGRGGAIVNVSSRASRIGSPGTYVDYAASKAAVDTLTLGLAKEVADEGIRVNAVSPGIIRTDIHASGGDPERLERMKDSIPMKRVGEPEEVARAILWLLSDEASYSTGTILDVSGGR
jgi:NAD(P)-dependent dehydrogenase (short-subunit alcohol dehydrogenase family)